MLGLEIYYNFIRKHEALKNKSPSELATDTEQKQTAHFSVQSVSPEIKISDSFKIRDFEDD